MRLLVAGLSESDSELVFRVLGPRVQSAGILPDWRVLEKAVEQSRPELVMLYLGSRPGQALTLARRVMNVYPKVRIIGLADTESQELIDLAQEAGIAELALLEQGTADLEQAVDRLLLQQKERASADGTVLALIGAKGGVGTTTLAVNIAAELADGGKKRVVLVDLHLYLGDIAANLDLTPDPSVLWFLARGAQADAKMWSEGPPKHRAGFRMMGLDGDLRTAEQVSAEQVVFLIDMLRGHYDHVVLDCGSNLGEVSLAACTASDQRLIVLTDELASLLGARRRVIALQALEMPGTLGDGVLNRVTTGVDIKAIEDASGLQIVSQVANAWRDVYGAAERAQVLRESAPTATVRTDILRLAQQLSGIPGTDTRKSRAFFSFFR